MDSDAVSSKKWITPRISLWEKQVVDELQRLAKAKRSAGRQLEYIEGILKPLTAMLPEERTIFDCTGLLHPLSWKSAKRPTRDEWNKQLGLQKVTGESDNRI